MRKGGLEPPSLSALAPKASVFAISPLPHVAERDSEAGEVARYLKSIADSEFASADVFAPAGFPYLGLVQEQNAEPFA